jgi:hypothetical protein
MCRTCLMTVDVKLMSAMRGSGQAPSQPLCRTIRRDCALHPAFGFGLQQVVKTLQVVGATGPKGERAEITPLNDWDVGVGLEYLSVHLVLISLCSLIPKSFKADSHV